MSEQREFYAHTEYHDGWWAYVSVVGAQQGYWRKPRFTRFGAQLAAHRKVWQLRRFEARGWLRG